MGSGDEWIMSGGAIIVYPDPPPIETVASFVITYAKSRAFRKAHGEALSAL